MVGPAARILSPSPDATNGVSCATRREAWVTGFDCGAGAYLRSAVLAPPLPRGPRLEGRGRQTAITSAAHDDALQRLSAELVEQDRLAERYEASIGTSTEMSAYMRLRDAGDQVAAREAWLHWVDDEGHRGLNAGPFELFHESAA